MSATNLLANSAPRLQAHFCESSGLTVPAGTVAAGHECAAFRLWIDDLPAAGNDALLQLRGCGFAYDLLELEAQLRQALRCGPAGPMAPDRRPAACSTCWPTTTTPSASSSRKELDSSASGGSGARRTRGNSPPSWPSRAMRKPTRAGRRSGKTPTGPRRSRRRMGSW